MNDPMIANKGLGDRAIEAGKVAEARVTRLLEEQVKADKAARDQAEKDQIAKDEAGGWDVYDRNVTRWVKLKHKSVALQVASVTPMSFTPGKGSFAHTVTAALGVDVMLKKYVPSAVNNLVFNCHGFASRHKFRANPPCCLDDRNPRSSRHTADFDTPHLIIGNLIHLSNVHQFKEIQGRVNVIWLSACNIAVGDKGDELCKIMAKTANAYVVAAQNQVTQNVRIDSVEDTAGATWKYYTPDGGLLGRHSFIAKGPTLGFEYERSPKPKGKTTPRTLPR